MRTGIIVIGFKRLDYFGHTLRGLERTPEADTLDFHFFLDGGPEARQDELQAMIEASSITHRFIVRRDDNWGIGRHLIDARRQMFDGYGYDRVILFEDDMIPAPTYITTTLKLSDWGHAYDNVGTVMSFNLLDDDEQTQRGGLRTVIPTNRHFWGYCLTRTVWDRIKHLLYRYEDTYLQGRPYRKRNHAHIRSHFIPHWMAQPRRTPDGQVLEVDAEAQVPPFNVIDGTTPTSQDAMTALGLWNQGYLRLTTWVPRARYVGIHGFSFRPDVFLAQGFDRQRTYEFAEDAKLDGFDLENIRPRVYE